MIRDPTRAPPGRLVDFASEHIVSNNTSKVTNHCIQRSRPMHSRLSRRRNSVTAVVAVAAAALTLAGCSSGAAKSENSGKPEPATITFAASTLGDPGRGPGLQKL